MNRRDDMTRYLSVVDEAYRATVEEQDDTAVWFTHAIKNAGAEVALLLQGDAVAYAQPGQDASGLRFGTREVRVPPRLDDDLREVMAKGVAVHVVSDDADERGLPEGGLLPGVQRVSRAHVARLIAEYDRVIYW
jgi:hypothetical protein